MQGYSICTFPRNDTVAASCCANGNLPNPHNSTSACNTTDTGKLGACLLEHGIFLDTARYFAPSSATRSVHLGYVRSFSIVALILMTTSALAVPSPSLLDSRYDPRSASHLSNTYSGRNTIQCKRFEPDQNRSNWDFDAYLPSLRVSKGISDCTQSGAPCRLASSDQTVKTLRMQWAISGRASAEPNVDSSAILSTLGSRYVASVTSTPLDGFYVPMGQKGYLMVYSPGVKVPGVYTDCGNGQQYNGSVLVPEAHGATLNTILIS